MDSEAVLDDADAPPGDNAPAMPAQNSEVQAAFEDFTDANLASGPFSDIPVLPDDLETLTEAWVNRWAEWIAAGRPEIPDEAKLVEPHLFAELDWNPAAHPRDPDTGKFVERPFDIPSDAPNFSDMSTKETLSYIDENGGDVGGTVFDPATSVTVDGVPNDATSFDEITDDQGTGVFGGIERTDPVKVDNISTDSFEEEAIISDYISGGYNQVNNALRRDGSNYTPRTEEMIDTLNKYINRADEFDEPTTVYRGLSADSEVKQQFSESEEGDFIQLSGFQSTTHDPDIADRFADSDDGVMLSIETDSGLPIYAVDGVNDAEEEVLLSHERYYKVKGITETDDGLYVELEG